ncbi:MAG: flagellar hook-length control protein FliK [Nitrospirota bacterium]
MINPITDLDSRLLTIIKPLGKSIPLMLGEIVKAEIIDILPTGSVTLKIKGSSLTAKTKIPLLKDSTVFFKVLSADKSGKELRLQFMGYADETVNEQLIHDYKHDTISKLMQDLSKAILKEGRVAKNFSGIVEQLLKLLPSDINSLSKEIMIQLQILLQSSLKQTGEGIQTRLDNLLKSLPQDFLDKDFVVRIVRNFKENMINIEQLLTVYSENPPSPPFSKGGMGGLFLFKNAVHDTGVALEAKLKSIVELLQHMPLSQPDMSPVKKDFKAGLLQLRHYLQEVGKDSLVKLVDGLLKDIETLQLLSKTTDSFWTFLPVSWSELKDGEIAFKRRRGDTGGRSYSCRINLDLKSLGKLSIMVLMLNKEFFISFRVENDGFRGVLNTHMNELTDGFSEKGLKLKASIFLEKDNSSEGFEKFESVVGIINIQI